MTYPSTDDNCASVGFYFLVIVCQEICQDVNSLLSPLVWDGLSPKCQTWQTPYFWPCNEHFAWKYYSLDGHETLKRITQQNQKNWDIFLEQFHFRIYLTESDPASMQSCRTTSGCRGDIVLRLLFLRLLHLLSPVSITSSTICLLTDYC